MPLSPAVPDAEAAKQRPASLNHPNYAMPSLVQSRGTDASVSQC